MESKDSIPTPRVNGAEASEGGVSSEYGAGYRETLGVCLTVIA